VANRAKDWLNQAENDFLWAKDSLERAYWSQICFTAQQIAKKSLKAIAMHRGALEVKSHSLVMIAAALDENGELERMGKRLDQYYISARYPDAFAEGSPYQYFSEEQAREALGFARAFLDRTRVELGGEVDAV
jgi:HEPN domain-containing protein